MCVLVLGASPNTSCGGGSGTRKDLAWPWKDQMILSWRTSILLPVSSLNLTTVCSARMNVTWCFCLCSSFCVRSAAGICTSVEILEKPVSREPLCKVEVGCHLRTGLRSVSLHIKSRFCTYFHSAKKTCVLLESFVLELIWEVQSALRWLDNSSSHLTDVILKHAICVGSRSRKGRYKDWCSSCCLFQAV